jgi:hypothetical protein
MHTFDIYTKNIIKKKYLDIPNTHIVQLIFFLNVHLPKRLEEQHPVEKHTSRSRRVDGRQLTFRYVLNRDEWKRNKSRYRKW